METLNTITTNFMVLWDAPKDWSLDGGLIWLTSFMAITIPVFSYVVWRHEKELEKKVVYQAATKVAKARIARMDRDGFIEKWNN